MNINELYSLICNLPQINSVNYGIMIPYHEIYNSLVKQHNFLDNTSMIDEMLKELQKTFPDKIKLIQDEYDQLEGVQIME